MTQERRAPCATAGQLSDWIGAVHGELHSDGVSFSEIAERFGTPVYVYSASRIRANIDRFQRAFAGLPVSFFYAAKANSNGSVLRVVHRGGFGVEVVSMGEFRRAVDAGVSADAMVFSGVGKRPEESIEASAAGLRAVIVESVEELENLAQAATAASAEVPVAIRVHPRIDAQTHPYLATGAFGSKFGLDPEARWRALELLSASKALRLVGLHIHLGSQIREVQPYLDGLDALKVVLAEARDRGLGPEFLDLGGGFGIPYDVAGGAYPLKALAEALRMAWPSGMRLHLEPGRIVVGDAGVLLTRVVLRKRAHGKRFVVVDAGMNTLIRPCLYGASHRIVPVREIEGNATPADVVGPICEGSDVLAKDCAMGDVPQGGLLAVMDAGAYGFAMASQYNSHPRPAEVMILGGETHLVRQRESWQDLVQHERVPAQLEAVGREEGGMT